MKFLLLSTYILGFKCNLLSIICPKEEPQKHKLIYPYVSLDIKPLKPLNPSISRRTLKTPKPQTPYFSIFFHSPLLPLFTWLRCCWELLLDKRRQPPRHGTFLLTIDHVKRIEKPLWKPTAAVYQRNPSNISKKMLSNLLLLFLWKTIAISHFIW